MKLTNNNPYALLEAKQAEIINKMAELHLMFNMPYVIVDAKSGELIEQGYKWTDEEAKNTFLELQKVLYELQKALQEEPRYSAKVTL